MTSENAIEIRIKMKRKRISQIKIARQLHVSHAAVYNVIEGKSVSHRIQQAIAKAVGSSIAELWPDDDDGDERRAA
jgi:transcriptional regulator with XRE-family HTH domain